MVKGSKTGYPYDDLSSQSETGHVFLRRLFEMRLKMIRALDCVARR